MRLDGRKVWQQAAGDNNRDYADLCLRWGVILNGPGRDGAWPSCKEVLRANNWGSRKITDLRRFAERMRDGDVVVLRLGTSTVCGVGIVTGDYLWDERFGDVDGWDLQHVRRVRWIWNRGTDGNHPALNSWALKQGDTTQLLREHGDVYDWLQLLHVDDLIHVALPTLPYDAGGAITVRSISDYLFDCGVASSSIATLVDQMDDLQRIASWYRRVDQNPSEHETVAYLVVPLLRTLGWTPQRMAVEWRNVDVALFDTLPRRDETLQVVVEAKRMRRSCLSALGQASAYASTRDSCRRLIVTDGLRYGVYLKPEGGSFKLHAYMNLQRLQSTYPVYDCAGASEALWAMTPEWRQMNVLR